jgi:acetylglutamate kinase
VISSIAIGTDGALFNVNADAAASAIAVAHGAKELLFLTDVPGLLDHAGTVVPHLTSTGVAAMLSSPAVSGGMKPKLQAALAALNAGVVQIKITAPQTDAQYPTPGGTTLVAA